MGWGDCGLDSRGRHIGYSWEAKCDHKGCKARIDRGLYYACGGMHLADEVSCERYFCEDHLTHVDVTLCGRAGDRNSVQLCEECAAYLNVNDDLVAVPDGFTYNVVGDTYRCDLHPDGPNPQCHQCEWLEELLKEKRESDVRMAGLYRESSCLQKGE